MPVDIHHDNKPLLKLSAANVFKLLSKGREEIDDVLFAIVDAEIENRFIGDVMKTYDVSEDVANNYLESGDLDDLHTYFTKEVLVETFHGLAELGNARLLIKFLKQTTIGHALYPKVIKAGVIRDALYVIAQTSYADAISFSKYLIEETRFFGGDIRRRTAYFNLQSSDACRSEFESVLKPLVKTTCDIGIGNLEYYELAFTGARLFALFENEKLAKQSILMSMLAYKINQEAEAGAGASKTRRVIRDRAGIAENVLSNLLEQILSSATHPAMTRFDVFFETVNTLRPFCDIGCFLSKLIVIDAISVLLAAILSSSSISASIKYQIFFDLVKQLDANYEGEGMSAILINTLVKHAVPGSNVFDLVRLFDALEEKFERQDIICLLDKIKSKSNSSLDPFISHLQSKLKRNICAGCESMTLSD